MMRYADLIRKVRELVDPQDLSVERDPYVKNLTVKWDSFREDFLDRYRDPKVCKPLRLMPVDSLVAAVAKREPRQLRIKLVSGVAALIRGIYGVYLNKEDSATIVVSTDRSFCWTRFSIVKELMHHYFEVVDNLGTGTVLNPEISRQIMDNAISSRELIPDENRELGPEAAAFYMAFEALVPWNLRSQFEMMRTDGASAYQIAKAFMIPQNFIENVLEDRDGHENYMGLSRRVNQKICCVAANTPRDTRAAWVGGSCLWRRVEGCPL